jgi:hypothetical protein
MKTEIFEIYFLILKCFEIFEILKFFENFGIWNFLKILKSYENVIVNFFEIFEILKFFEHFWNFELFNGFFS